jgi:hypothetical protein
LLVDPSFLQSVNTSVLPRSDNTYDLGSSSYRWRNGYFAELVDISKAFTSANQKGLSIRDTTTTSGELFIGEGTSTANAFLPQIRGISEGIDGYGLSVVGAISPTNDAYNSIGAAVVIDGRRSDDTVLANANVLVVRTLTTPLLRVKANGITELKHLYPMGDNSYDLGSSSYRWKDGWFANVIADIHKVNTPYSDVHSVGANRDLIIGLILPSLGDCLAFRHNTIEDIEYYNFDTGTWEPWTDAPDFSSLFDTRYGTGISVDYTHRRFRFTIQPANRSVVISHFLIHGDHFNYKEVIIEKSDDKVTWTEYARATDVNCRVGPIT